MKPSPPVTKRVSLNLDLGIEFFANMSGRFMETVKGAYIKPFARNLDGPKLTLGNIGVQEVGNLVLASG